MKKELKKFLITCAIAICLIIPTLKVSAEDSAADVNVLDSGAIAMYTTSITNYRDTKLMGIIRKRRMHLKDMKAGYLLVGTKKKRVKLRWVKVIQLVRHGQSLCLQMY